MIQAVIIDDEKKCVSLLKHLVDNYCPEIQVVAVAHSALEGIAIIKTWKPGLVFLDIEMPDKTGFELLNSLQDIDFQVIFTTAYDHYAIKAIRFSALDYLLKPIDLNDLKEALLRLDKKQSTANRLNNIDMLVQNIRSLQPNFSKITLSTQEGLVILQVNEIVYCQASGAYTLFFLKNKEKVTASRILKEYEDLLKEHNFFRVHNSWLVNMNEIRKYVKGDGGYVVMSNGDEVQVSKRKKDEFLEILNK